MHLRRLIVLIINARNIINLIRSCTAEVSIIGPMYNRCIAASGLIGQIKKTRIHVQALCLSEGVGSNETVLHLFTMSKYPAMETSRSQKHGQTLLFVQHVICVACLGDLKPKFHPKRSLVEPDGIEPTTSCLQSRRSPS